MTDPLWHRQPYETDAAFNAFHQFFLSQPPPRSIDEAYRQYKGYSRDTRKRAVLSFRRWSQGVTRTKAPIPGGLTWEERARAFDNHQASLREAELEARHMPPAEVLALLSDIARGDIGKFSDVIALRDLGNHPLSEIVQEINSNTDEREDGRVKHQFRFKLYSKLDALEKLARHYGLFQDINKNFNFDVSQLTDEQLKRIAAGEDPFSVVATSSSGGTGTTTPE